MLENPGINCISSDHYIILAQSAGKQLVAARFLSNYLAISQKRFGLVWLGRSGKAETIRIVSRFPLVHVLNVVFKADLGFCLEHCLYCALHEHIYLLSILHQVTDDYHEGSSASIAA